MHTRPTYRLANRLRIVRVILVALAVRNHKLRRYQPHRVPEFGEFARPVVRASTGLYSDQTGR